MQNVVEEILCQNGYRFRQGITRGTGYCYQLTQDGFRVILTVHLGENTVLPIEQHERICQEVKNFFYHPQNTLENIPDNFVVNQVELLTIVVTQDAEAAKKCCSLNRNMWAYIIDGPVLIYENQPGDFYGVRGMLEQTNVKDNSIKKGNFSIPQSVWAGCQAYGITILLVLANVIVYLVLELMGNTQSGEFIAAHGGMYPEFIQQEHQWWRILTSMFIHFGITHLMNNMVIFCCVGSRLERAVGHWKFLIIYLISGIGGGLLSYLAMLQSGDYAVSAGASGAVFGVIGAMLWVVIFNKGHFEGLTTRGLLFMAVLSLYFGFTSTGVDNWCHVGGCITGFLIAALLYHKRRNQSRENL